MQPRKPPPPRPPLMVKPVGPRPQPPAQLYANKFVINKQDIIDHRYDRFDAKFCQGGYCPNCGRAGNEFGHVNCGVCSTRLARFDAFTGIGWRESRRNRLVVLPPDRPADLSLGHFSRNSLTYLAAAFVVVVCWLLIVTGLNGNPRCN